MATLYYLVFVLLLTSHLLQATRQHCPSECHCNNTNKEYAAICSKIPGNIPHVTNLTIINQEVSTASFSELPSLHHLSCAHCQIRQLDLDAFRNSNQLETIDLSHNQLTHLPLEVFAHLNNLYSLNVSENTGLDCASVLSQFTCLPQLKIVCSATLRSPRSLPSDEQNNTAIVEDKPYYQLPCFNRPRVRRCITEPCDTRVTRDVVVETEETGWGVGTYVVLAILILIISLICFKFVFQRMRKRCKKRAQRPSEEEPLEENHA